MPIKAALFALLLASTLATPFAVRAQEATPVTDASTVLQTIEPVVWNLQSIAAPDGELLPGDRTYTVQFQPEGELGVQADCNRGRGSWTAEADVLTLGRIGVTRMMCPEGSIDQSFLLALGDATSWSYEEDRLILDTAASGRLTFTPALEGVAWVWEGFEGSDGSTVVPPDPTKYALTFLPEGKLAVKADCNRGAGNWVFNAPEIDLSVGGLTRMACPPESLADVFVRDVDTVSSAVFRDGKLYLALPVDGGIHTFAARFTPVVGPESEATPEA